MTKPKNRKIAIPSVGPGTLTSTTEATRFLDAIKQNLDVITGRASGMNPIDPLPVNASLSDVIGVVNRIISRIETEG